MIGILWLATPLTIYTYSVADSEWRSSEYLFTKWWPLHSACEEDLDKVLKD